MGGLTGTVARAVKIGEARAVKTGEGAKVGTGKETV